jgi:hypothetical protein
LSIAAIFSFGGGGGADLFVGLLDAIGGVEGLGGGGADLGGGGRGVSSASCENAGLAAGGVATGRAAASDAGGGGIPGPPVVPRLPNI